MPSNPPHRRHRPSHHHHPAHRLAWLLRVVPALAPALVPVIALLLGIVVAPGAQAQDEEAPKQPKLPFAPGDKPQEDKIELHPFARKLIDDPINTPAEKRALQLFHGQWGGFKPTTPDETARVALGRYDLRNNVFDNEKVSPMLRAEAALRRGEPDLTLKLLKDHDTVPAKLLRSRALDQLGKLAEATAELKALREKLELDEIASAKDLVAATEAFITLARLEGRPASDYHLAMRMLAKARNELDRAYWPASLVEAELLLEKFNRPEAAKALIDTLRLNPGNGEAWYALGSLAAGSFNFEKAEAVVKELRAINPKHPLADMLEARLALQQKDYAAAEAALKKLLAAYPTHREVRALEVAMLALAHRDDAVAKALKQYEALSPGSAQPFYEAGSYLSYARQYVESGKMLRKAIERRPNWPAPRLELGLMLMQKGDDKAAFTELSRATKLDPFNVRANNQQRLVEQLLGYEVIRTKHFLIKCKAGIDQVLARDMAREVEQMYSELTEAFDHKPDSVSFIEIMPDAASFAVRITGIPELWTIAACTGDVVAMAPPREGRGQKGHYDWYRVLRHEYVHTVTLDQTDNRIPHWLTEACAVSEEPGGRDYNTHQLLAMSYYKNELFDLKTINWGFVRPRRPNDRQLAYAQAHWMLEFIVERFGRDALIKLLRYYRTNTDEIAGIQQITGMKHSDFMATFKQWAGKQVNGWGFVKPPEDEKLRAFLKSGKAPKLVLRDWLKRYPGQPDLLRLEAERSVREESAEDARRAIEAYAAARPVDTWSQRALVQLAAKRGKLMEAKDALAELDRKEVSSGSYAYQLAQLYRNARELDSAAYFAKRALYREPYNGTYRELLATLRLQQGKMEDALFHLQAMPMLEPERALHQVRLAAIYKRMGKDKEAAAAAKAAIELDKDLESRLKPFLEVKQ